MTIAQVIEETRTTPVTYPDPSHYKMMMKEIKESQKKLAIEIRLKKSKRKGSKYGYVSGLGRDSYRYRHYHIAYSELRGRTREQIEQKCDEPPNESWIQEIKDSVSKEN